MTIAFTSFTDYLGMLPSEQGQLGAAVREEVERQVRARTGADLSAFVFLPDQTDHPDHTDAARVFAQAVEQMYLPKPWVGEEVPLLFIGYHVMNRLTGKRTSQGLLLTDQAVYVQDDSTVLLAQPVAQGHTLPSQAADAIAFVANLLAHYKAWKDWAALADDSQAALSARCRALLVAAVETVVEFHAKHGSQRRPALRAWTLAILVSEHGAGDTLLDPANPKLAKKLGKVAGKFQVPTTETLLLALADFPMFGGPYGLALTERALYSKDLMEEPLRIALEVLDARALKFGSKDDELLTGTGQKITLPAHLPTGLKSPFLELLQQEILRIQSRA